MDHSFDDDYWDEVWSGDKALAMSTSPPNPHLQAEVGDLTPGTAIDVGCGADAEAIWFATRGWQVTGTDVARAALAIGRERAARAGVADQVQWVQADVSTWTPETAYDLVTTHYAHARIPQLDLYRRIASWVAPAGTLLVVGHLHPDQHSGGHGHGHGDGDGDDQPPAEASATATAITALLDPASWDVVTAEESQRDTAGPEGRQRTIHDVVVRATRRA